MPQIKRAKRSLPRVHSLKGVTARADARIKNHSTQVPKGGSGFQYQRPPGSMNPRKVGR